MGYYNDFVDWFNHNKYQDVNDEELYLVYLEKLRVDVRFLRIL